MALREVEICHYCSDLVPPKHEPPSARAHQPNLAFLQQSSETCVICEMIVSTWPLAAAHERFPDIAEDSYESILVTVRLSDVQTSELTSGLSWALWEIGFELPSYAFMYQSKFSIATCDAESPSAELPIWKASTTSIQDKMSMLKIWLRNCKLNHSICKPARAHRPKRLIEVGTEDGLSPRLVICELLDPQHVEYATLSYCWGDSASKLTTTRETLDRYRQQIPFELLPQTYKDAVEITRTLHIPYLWIDSMCIIQDDDMDWKLEAPRMQDIYSGSTLTIAATDAPNTSTGCFFPYGDTGSTARRSEDEFRDNCELFTVTNKGKDASTMLLRIDPGDIRESTNGSILNTRGWVLQEMVLSHRTVHCMQSQLQWQCRYSCMSESGIEFANDAMSHGRHQRSIPALVGDTLGMNKIWWKWMEDYSTRKFTYPRDRLPAMAGLIQHYQSVTKHTTILGLWKESFAQDLLWMRTGELPEKIDGKIPNMPSWSWLSCPTIIKFDKWHSSKRDEFTYDHVTLVDWDVTWGGEPLTSDIKSTRLVIDGPVCEIPLAVAPEAANFNPPYFNVGTETPNLDKHPIPWRCSGQFDVENRKTSNRYLCLLLRSMTLETGENLREVFLILEPSPAGPARITYRRIGLGQIRGKVLDQEEADVAMTMKSTMSLYAEIQHLNITDLTIERGVEPQTQMTAMVHARNEGSTDLSTFLFRNPNSLKSSPCIYPGAPITNYKCLRAVCKYSPGELLRAPPLRY